MADEDNPLSLLNQDEYDAQFKQDKTASEKTAEPYQGPERRSGEDRRKGQRDRRAMLRFEPEKDTADRRSGKDRRTANNKPDDLWKQRDI